MVAYTGPLQSLSHERLARIEDGGDVVGPILQEFDYDVTIMAFNIRITLTSADVVFAKGYG